MPSAVTSPNDVERYELKTCEGAFVELRRMTYGEFLHRQELAMGMSMSGKSKDDLQMAMNIASRKTTEYEFAHCIVEHNLEDENGTPLDFQKGATLDRLNPRIGNEINLYIDQMNQYDEGN